MKELFEVDAGSFRLALKRMASAFSGRRSGIEICDHVKATVAPNGVELSGTNLEQRIEILLPRGDAVKCLNFDEFTFDYRLVAKFARLAVEPLVFSRISDKGIEITSGDLSYQTISYDVADFPDKWTITNCHYFAISPRLLEMMQYVASVISIDDSRTALHGVLFEAKANGTTVTATDGKRLLTWDDESILSSNDPVVKGIIPGDVIKSLKSAFMGHFECSSGYRLLVSDVGWVIKRENVTVYFLPINGEFPNWRQVFPEKFKVQFQIESDTLRRAIESAKVIKNAGYSEFLFENQSMIVTTGSEAEGTMQTNHEIDFMGDYHVALMVKQLAPILRLGKVITIKANDAFSQLVFAGGNGRYCIMPMRNR